VKTGAIGRVDRDTLRSREQKCLTHLYADKMHPVRANTVCALSRRNISQRVKRLPHGRFMVSARGEKKKNHSEDPQREGWYPWQAKSGRELRVLRKSKTKTPSRGLEGLRSGVLRLVGNANDEKGICQGPMTVEKSNLFKKKSPIRGR